MSILIKEVTDKASRLEFVKFPIGLYDGSPFYVPSLIMDEMDQLNIEKNPAFDFCEQQLFLAYRGNKIVGRIAGIINKKANEVWNNKHARFGFVDFIDDAEVVDALFAAAEKWAKEKGMDAIQGPMGFTDLDHEGLLVDGYDRVGTTATIYNYPYYRGHIERLGYVQDAKWKEYLIPVPERVPERYQRISDIVAKKYGLAVLKFKNHKQIKPYINKVFNLVNEAYAPLYGFVPLSQKQIDYYVKTYVPVLRWDVVTIIIEENSDEVVGFGLAAPSISEALQRSRGKIFPLGWLYLLQALKGKKNKVVDLMLIGVAPEYQGKGVNALIFNDFIPSAYNCGYRFAETNPELETNNKVANLWDGFDPVNHKARIAYIKKLD